MTKHVSRPISIEPVEFNSCCSTAQYCLARHRFVCKDHPTWKSKYSMKLWTVARVIMWRVWTWRRNKKSLSYIVMLFNTTMPKSCTERTLRSPDVTRLKQTHWCGISGFEFSVAVQLFIQNITPACLFDLRFNIIYWKNESRSVSIYVRGELHP